ncbi:hypothetical protein TWF730_002056 [Orbilia blumenaviensis]|uniref:Uncharacterized protein n=1 Tax=Orbilia blumenaviensis TaxID=1796055 RepID=A0AAV9UDT0_9PEZI
MLNPTLVGGAGALSEQKEHRETETTKEEYPHEIYDLACICDGLFTSSGQRDPVSAQIGDLQQKFWAWSNGIGVFAEPWMSLDQRLKRHPDLQKLFIFLLKILRRNLDYILRLCPPRIPQPSKTTPDMFVDSDAVDASLEGIDDAIFRLQRLAVMIRQSSKGSLKTKIESHWLENDLGSFPDFISAYIDCKFGSAHQGLRRQLKKSLIYRRQRIEYQRDHQRRLTRKRRHYIHNQPAADEPESMVTQRSNTMPTFELRKEPGTRNLHRSKELEILSHVLSRPSTLDAKKFDDTEQESKQTKEPVTCSPSVFTGDIKADYPPIPSPKPGEIHAECPICYQEFESFKDAKQWRRHVDEDLECYVCISEHCEASSVYFTDRVKWLQHMQDNHTPSWPQLIHRSIWRCITEHENDLDFESVEEMYQHMRDVHSKICGEQQLDIIVHGSEIQKLRPDSMCPLCCNDIKPSPDSDDTEAGLGFPKNEQEDPAASELPSRTHKAREPKGTVRFAGELTRGDLSSHKNDPSPSGSDQGDSIRGLKLSMKMANHIGDHLKALAFQALYDPLEVNDSAHESRVSSGSNSPYDLSQDDLSSLGYQGLDSEAYERNKDPKVLDIQGELAFTSQSLISDGEELSLDPILEHIRMAMLRSKSSSGKESQNVLRWLSLDKERQNVLRWLSPVEYAAPQVNTFPARQIEASKRFLHTADFIDWLGSGWNNLLYVKTPWAGNKMIASIVFDHLQTLWDRKTFPDHKTGIVFLHFIPKIQGSQKIRDVLASILGQLTVWQPMIPESIWELYQKKSQTPRLSQSEIRDALQEILKAYSRIFIIIDALDERKTDNIRNELWLEVDELRGLTKIRMIVVPRRNIVPESTNDVMRLEIRAHAEDIDRYISSQIPQLPKIVHDNFELQREIKTCISALADGMFPLAQLCIDSLRDKTTKDEIDNELENMWEKELYQVYSNTVDRIRNQERGSRGLAEKALFWVVHAKRQLTTEELRHALAVEPDTSKLDEDNLVSLEDIVSCCAGLVTVDENSKIVRLVDSAIAYYFRNRWNFPDVQNDLIAVTCLTYLSFDVFDEGPVSDLQSRLQQNPFYDYAAQNWADHTIDVQESVLDLALKFLWNDSKTLAASQLLSRGNNALCGLHLVCYSGLELIAKSFITQDNANAKDRSGRTPLSYAAESGRVEVVELLLANGAHPDIEEENGWRPLSYAIESGHVVIVRRLLACKVTVNYSYGLEVSTPSNVRINMYMSG